MLCLLTLAIQGFPFNSILDLAAVSIHPCFVMHLAITVRRLLVLGYLNISSKKQRGAGGAVPTKTTKKPPLPVFSGRKCPLSFYLEIQAFFWIIGTKHSNWPREIHGTSQETSYNAYIWELWYTYTYTSNCTLTEHCEPGYSRGCGCCLIFLFCRIFNANEGENVLNW